jgi:hypothetical protein
LELQTNPKNFKTKFYLDVIVQQFSVVDLLIGQMQRVDLLEVVQGLLHVLQWNIFVQLKKQEKNKNYKNLTSVTTDWKNLDVINSF